MLFGTMMLDEINGGNYCAYVKHRAKAEHQRRRAEQKSEGPASAEKAYLGGARCDRLDLSAAIVHHSAKGPSSRHRAREAAGSRRALQGERVLSLKTAVRRAGCQVARSPIIGDGHRYVLHLFSCGEPHGIHRVCRRRLPLRPIPKRPSLTRSRLVIRT